VRAELAKVLETSHSRATSGPSAPSRGYRDDAQTSGGASDARPAWRRGHHDQERAPKARENADTACVVFRNINTRRLWRCACSGMRTRESRPQDGCPPRQRDTLKGWRISRPGGRRSAFPAWRPDWTRYPTACVAASWSSERANACRNHIGEGLFRSLTRQYI